MDFGTKPIMWNRVLIALTGLGIFFFIMNWRGAIDYENFYKARINDVLVSCDDSQIRTKYFYTRGNIEITTTLIPPNTFDLGIGDSIVKGGNSSIFKVYRKNNEGVFKHLYTYNYIRS